VSVAQNGIDGGDANRSTYLSRVPSVNFLSFYIGSSTIPSWCRFEAHSVVACGSRGRRLVAPRSQRYMYHLRKLKVAAGVEQYDEKNCSLVVCSYTRALRTSVRHTRLPPTPWSNLCVPNLLSENIAVDRRCQRVPFA
jgi:hypothetical protein